MANCVGHGNYQQFFLMLTYLWLGSIYSVRSNRLCDPDFSSTEELTSYQL